MVRGEGVHCPREIESEIVRDCPRLSEIVRVGARGADRALPRLCAAMARRVLAQHHRAPRRTAPGVWRATARGARPALPQPRRSGKLPPSAGGAPAWCQRRRRQRQRGPDRAAPRRPRPKGGPALLPQEGRASGLCQRGQRFRRPRAPAVGTRPARPARGRVSRGEARGARAPSVGPRLRLAAARGSRRHRHARRAMTHVCVSSLVSCY
mmetsp:Transcript_40427/g.130928  ORF Transcript_40427/g.130928 Transcript_40427/m.130928 type:complete len:209 (+) Transcript_40427:1064-1690(+)